MTLSRVIMVFSLAVLAFVLYNTINETEERLSNTITSQPLEINSNNEGMMNNFLKKPVMKPVMKPVKKTEANKVANKTIEVAKDLISNLSGKNYKEKEEEEKKKEGPGEQLDNTETEHFESRNLEEGFNYEEFEANPLTNDDGAPIAEVNQQITDAEEDEEDLQIDGTDLLAAPLVDRFHSLNSIANVNRNSSQDLRGDIEITYNDKYTPFYASHIYGEPLHANKLH